MGNAENVYPRGIPDTRLYGSWLVLARAAWLLVVALSLAVPIADIPLEFKRFHTVCVGSSCGQQLTAGIVQELHHLHLSVDFFAAYLVVLEFGFLFVWVAIALLLFFYLFPDGRFVPRWTLAIVLVYALLNIPESFIPTAPNGTISVLLGLPLLAAVVGIGLFSQVYRYKRVSNAVQRQQTKWVVYGVVAAVILFTGIVSLGPVFFTRPALFPALFAHTAIAGIELLIPLSIGFSVLRYRLYDIDVLINRTLVYGILTVLLALVYFGLVFASQNLLGGIIHSNNGVTIVISTLAVAALFQPLRARTQRVIDRRFYRRKYDAARTLADFSAALRSEVDLNTLCDHLLEVVQETMLPAHISLWVASRGKDDKRREEV